MSLAKRNTSNPHYVEPSYSFYLNHHLFQNEAVKELEKANLKYARFLRERNVKFRCFHSVEELTHIPDYALIVPLVANGPMCVAVDSFFSKEDLSDLIVFLKTMHGNYAYPICISQENFNRFQVAVEVIHHEDGTIVERYVSVEPESLVKSMIQDIDSQKRTLYSITDLYKDRRRIKAFSPSLYPRDDNLDFVGVRSLSGSEKTLEFKIVSREKANEVCEEYVKSSTYFHRHLTGIYTFTTYLPYLLVYSANHKTFATVVGYESLGGSKYQVYLQDLSTGGFLASNPLESVITEKNSSDFFVYKNEHFFMMAEPIDMFSSLVGSNKDDFVLSKKVGFNNYASFTTKEKIKLGFPIEMSLGYKEKRESEKFKSTSPNKNIDNTVKNLTEEEYDIESYYGHYENYGNYYTPKKPCKPVFFLHAEE